MLLIAERFVGFYYNNSRSGDGDSDARIIRSGRWRGRTPIITQQVWFRRHFPPSTTLSVVVLLRHALRSEHIVLLHGYTCWSAAAKRHTTACSFCCDSHLNIVGARPGHLQTFGVNTRVERMERRSKSGRRTDERPCLQQLQHKNMKQRAYQKRTQSHKYSKADYQDKATTTSRQ